MAGYKSLQVADALQRVTQQLTPQVTYGTLENSVYGRNTNTPDPTIQDVQAIQQANQAYQGLYNKTGGDYAQDAAVALGKGIVAVPQAAAGIVDLLDAGAQYATGQDVQGGRFSKTLADAGVDFARTQDIMQGWYSEGTQKQFQGLSQLPGMNMDNSVSDNLSSLRDTLGYVAENPSLAANTIVESLPLIAAGGVVGRGAASLGAKAAQGAIGEGTVMAGSAQANMTRNEQGYTTGQQALGAVGIGVLGGIVGQLGAKVAGHSGAADIDTLSSGLSQQVANKGFKSLAVGTASEAAEEAAQTSLENVISNVTSGRDAIQGLNQDLVLGTLAGAGMGAASNARSSIASSALQALQTAATRQAERMQDRIKTNAPEQSDVPTEDLVNTASADYNPGAAIVREVGSITADSTPEEISTAKTKADTVLNNAEESLANLQEMKQLLVEEPKVINGINSVQAILDTIGDTDPDRSAKGNAMMTALQQKMDNIKTIKDSFTTEQLDTAIAERTPKVQAARDMHNKYNSLLNTVTGDSTPDVKIFGAPSAYTPAQIAKAIDDPNVPETSKVALRALSDAVVAQNKVKDIDTVNGQIVGKRYDPNYRSTPQYIEQFAKALNSGSSAAQTNLLREIGAFEQSHTQKAALVSTGLEQAQATGQKVQVVRNQDGNWELNQGPLLSRDEATANGAITIHPTARGIAAVTKTNEYMQAEAQAITATRIAMEHMSNVRNNTNGTVTQPSNVATPSTPQTQETQAQPSSNIQDALDSYSQDLRDNYDFQPQRRVEDPRRTAPQASLDRSGLTENEVLSGTQLTSTSEPSGNTSQVQTTNTESTPEVVSPVKDDAYFQSKLDELDKQRAQFELTGDYVNAEKVYDEMQTVSREWQTNPSTAIPTTKRAEPSKGASDSAWGEFYRKNRNMMNEELFMGGHQDRNTLEEAAPEIQSRHAHGMAKATPAAAVRDLKDILENGIDQNRGQGRLFTAPLSQGKLTAEQRSAMSVSGTSSGSAYSDGAFTLIAKEGVGDIRSVSEIDAVMVNSAVPQEVVDGLRQDFPDMKFGYAKELPSLLSGGKDPTNTKAQAMEILEGNYSEDTHTVYQKEDGNWAVKKLATTREQAQDILEGKYSEETHEVTQKEDGNWTVRKRDLQAELDAMNLELDNNVGAFEEVNVDEDGEASAMVSEADADEKVTDVSARDAERAKPINERNLVIDGFNRKQVPLVAVPNLHQYLDNPKRIKAVITKLTKVQPEQQHIDNVEQFMYFRNAFANHINGSVKVRRNIKPEHAKYNWQDYLQFLVQDDGKFDDATITALAATAYTWVAENGEVTTKTEKDVAKLLRLRNVESVPPHVYEAMAQLGDLRNVTITSLGQRTAQALGYKLVNDVSELRKAKLEAALGSLVLKGLEGLNLVELTPVAAQDYANWKAEVEDANPGSRAGSLNGLSEDYTYNFVRIAQKDSEPTKGVKKIVEANKKTNGVLNKLFEVKATFTMPLTEPPKEVKSTFNSAGTPIPSEAEDTIKASQVRPYGFITPMVKVVDVLRELDAVEFKRMLGFMTENEVAEMQVMKQKGQQSVNESIERSLDIFDSFRGDLNNSGMGERADFYMPQFLVSNTRSHYDSDLNPQMDKIHRGLVGMKEHEVELDVSQELFTDKGITEMGRFIQALAMNMEEAPIYKNPLNNKYVTIDKANYKNFIPAFMAYIETPLVRNAITAMQNVQSGKASHKDLTHIQQAVAEFGMNMQSLRALQALADFDTARKYAAQGSSSKFRTDLTFESDGVTNGPFLTGVSTNTLADNARNAGGLFRDDRLTSVPEYKEGLGQDLYEFLGEAMKTAWASVKGAVLEKNKKMAIQAVNSLDTLYPAFGGRSGAKPITTTANYGAEDNSIKAANAREVINNLINKLDTNHISEALPFINAANDIIKYIDVIAKFKAKDEGKPHVAIPLIPTNVNPKQIKLEPTQIKTLFDYSKKMHGDAIEQALQIGMGDFIPVRNSLTNHASLAFEFFDVLRTDALEAATQRAIQEKTLETVNGKPIESISVKEKNRALREIAKYTPTFTNAMASVSSNKAQSSTPLMKTDLTWEESYQATSELHFNKASMKVHAHLRAPANPGVSGLALAIQSMDSFVTHFVMKRMASQNYHDANAGSIKEATKMAQLQNEGVFTALRTMHLSSGMIKAFLRSGNGVFDLGNLTKYEIFTKGVEEALRKMVNAKKDQQLNEFDLAAEIQQQVMGSFDRDIAKLRELAKEKYVGQYGTQEGHYTVTNADRKAIEKEVNKLKADRIRQLEEAARLGKALNEMTGYKKPSKTAVSLEAIMQDGIEYGKLKGLLQKELDQYTGESNTAAQQYSVLFKELMKMFDTAIPSDLVLKGISVNSPDVDNIPNIEQVRENRISAWFGKDAKGKDAIFFAQEAGMPTAKVVVHELLHAATVNAIAQFRANPDKYPEGKVALDRVEKLFNNVKNKVAKDKDASDIVKYGVQNLEEFIATGLTYPEFVDFLAKTQVQSGSRSKLKFTDGFAEFIKSVADVIGTFVKSKVFQSGRMISALEALVYDTTDIIQNSGNMQNELVPAPVQLDIFGAPQKARDAVSGYSSKQVFDALNSNISPEFKTHLSALITQVSDTIYSALDQRLITNPDGTWSAEQAWEQYIDAGNAVTTETAVTAGFRMTEQESFAVEALYAAFVHGLKDNAMTQVYAEMDKAFKAAKAKLKPENFYEGDWATASVQDKADAQDMYDFLFKLGNSNKEHLARFTAMALGSQQFNSMLGFSIRDTDAAPEGVFQKIVEYTNTLLNYVMGLLTNSSSSQLVNGKLNLLAKELARIDGKNRNFVVSKLEAQFDKLQDYADTASGAVRERVAKLAEHDAIANSRITAVRLASNVTRLSAKGDLWTTLDAIKDANTLNTPNERLGMWGEIINEAANNNPTKALFERMLRTTKLNNQMKENIRDTATKNVMSTFEENGSYLSKEDKHSFTVMLRADVQALDDTYSTAEIAKMYSDAKYLTTERNQLEAQLHGLDASSQVMINRAKQLAKYMITGLSSDGLAKNAQLIVSGFNSGEVVDRADTRVDLVDRIATMYAIEYTSAAHKARLNTIMKRELKNKVNGIDTSIKFHKELAKTARDTLFTDNITSVMKGYVPEVTNPNKDVRIANNELEAQVLKQQFYTEVKTLVKDGRDRTSTKPRLFMTEESGLQRIVSGAVEIVSTNRKGTEVFLEQADLANTITGITRSIPNSASYNPMKDPQVYMTPNYNTNNEVIGFSYEMSGNNRDTLLERNNDFAELLGAYAATNYNKVTVPNQNNKVIDAAYQDYKDNFTNDPRAYVNVGPTSTDPGLREVWAMLPEATREHVLNVWGDDGMFVRNDALLIMFGYRKYSLNQAFDKMEDARNMFEALYVGVMSMLFGNKAKVKGMQGERVWQEAVHTMKDIIVIRNVKTLIGNTMANAMLLMAHGVSSSDILKDSLLAIRAGTSYRKDMGQLMAIRQKQRAGIGDFNALEQEAFKLEDAIERNPLRDFINEGMMPTIVEDVDPSTDHYSYKSKMQQRVDEYTSAVPKSVKSAAKWLMVSPETPLYKFLNNATQFADFSSKYVLYKYATTKAKEKLSHNDALQLASDNFINYDVPTAKGLQYLNDMGVVMFTKYNLRIQKALFQLMKKRPASVMAQALLLHSFTNLETAIDPMVWFQMGSPLRTGAFGLPGALDEPLPIKMLTSVL